ncbi:MAG: cellulase family glycosylhydrolase [Spirochaetales bacterium]|nr:cellulase family glycosylhydrolase [Spirochaetales bacterium]
MTQEFTIQNSKLSLGRGINTDFTATEVNKVAYDKGFYTASKDAGFDSVRIFLRQGWDPAFYQACIDDALDLDLKIVIVPFSMYCWGKESLIRWWGEVAEYYKDYPAELVFEILNEPKMAGHPDGEEAETMKWYGECIKEIRKSNPTRLLAVGGPHYNGVKLLTNYVTPEHLDYKLEDGSGFSDDPNIWGVFHCYNPPAFTHASKDQDLNKDYPDWREQILSDLDEADAWSKKHNKRTYLSEWGARINHEIKYLEEYTAFMMDGLIKRDIEWCYYCGVFSNAWPYGLYNSEWGFAGVEGVVKNLTGIEPPEEVPPTNQIVNTDFQLDLADWNTTDYAIKGTADGQGVDGSRAIRVHVPFVPMDTFDPEMKRKMTPALYQQYEPDWQFTVKGQVQANKYTLQLREGSRYRISFFARCEVGSARLQVQLGHAPENEPVVWTSDVVVLDDELKRFEMTYDHKLESVHNVRFSFNFLDRHSEIILDQIELRGSRKS